MKITTLILMAIIHFILMYLLMYAMVSNVTYVYPNLNQFYMAGIMTSPMILLEILFMHSMYKNKVALKIAAGVSIVVFILIFYFIRKQSGIYDMDFLKSMIPHHAGAILMCNEASIQDSEIKDLCKNIILSQQTEIDFMVGKLRE